MTRSPSNPKWSGAGDHEDAMGTIHIYGLPDETRLRDIAQLIRQVHKIHFHVTQHGLTKREIMTRLQREPHSISRKIISRQLHIEIHEGGARR